jgi:hypothetical protein
MEIKWLGEVVGAAHRLPVAVAALGALETKGVADREPLQVTSLKTQQEPAVLEELFLMRFLTLC